MRKTNIPPKYIEINDIIFCKINGEIKECRVLHTFYQIEVSTLEDLKEIEDDPYMMVSRSLTTYTFKKWKYGIDWALTKAELEK